MSVITMGEIANLFKFAYNALVSSPLNQFFVLLMIALTIVEGISLAKGKRKDLKSALVSLGVLGTFCGVFIGLGGFNPKGIADSIPVLLAGLKIAFFTSMIGMILSVALSIYETIFVEKEDADDVGLHTLSYKLDKLDALEVIANNTATLVQVNGALRTEIREGLRANQQLIEAEFSKANTALEKALKTMSHGATEEVIKALNSVIADFNRQLTAQFGDNFKELNQAVVKLLEWQENYRRHIEEAEKRLKEIGISLEGSGRTIEMVAKTNADMHKVYDEVGKQITTYDSQIRTLHKQLETYADIGQKASNAFLTLDTGFNSILGSVDNITEQITSSLSSQSETVTKLTLNIREQLPESLGQLEKTLSTLTEKFGRDYESFLTKCNSLLPK